MGRLSRMPLLVPYWLAPDRSFIDGDVERWDRHTGRKDRHGLLGHLRLPEFRTLYYYRLRTNGGVAHALARILRVFYPGERTLHLDTPYIGPGFFIQHGFATIVSAERIGANCRVNQQVTIGWTRDGSPTLKDGVSVYAGALVLGKITLETGSRVGAGAIVTRDLPAGETAVGVPSHRARSQAPAS